jgi:hypothetical protein
MQEVHAGFEVRVSALNLVSLISEMPTESEVFEDAERILVPISSALARTELTAGRPTGNVPSKVAHLEIGCRNSRMNRRTVKLSRTIALQSKLKNIF